jgi:hypothetical protein
MQSKVAAVVLPVVKAQYVWWRAALTWLVFACAPVNHLVNPWQCAFMFFAAIAASGCVVVGCSALNKYLGIKLLTVEQLVKALRIISKQHSQAQAAAGGTSLTITQTHMMGSSMCQAVSVLTCSSGDGSSNDGGSSSSSSACAHTELEYGRLASDLFVGLLGSLTCMREWEGPLTKAAAQEAVEAPLYLLLQDEQRVREAMEFAMQAYLQETFGNNGLPHDFSINTKDLARGVLRFLIETPAAAAGSSGLLFRQLQRSTAGAAAAESSSKQAAVAAAAAAATTPAAAAGAVIKQIIGSGWLESSIVHYEDVSSKQHAAAGSNVEAPPAKSQSAKTLRLQEVFNDVRTCIIVE